MPSRFPKEDKNMTNINVIISRFEYKGEAFKIIFKEQDGVYCAVNYKYLDSEGRTTRELNGLQMNAHKTLNGCLNLTKISVDIKEMKQNGASEQEIMAAVVQMVMAQA